MAARATSACSAVGSVTITASRSCAGQRRPPVGFGGGAGYLRQCARPRVRIDVGDDRDPDVLPAGQQRQHHFAAQASAPQQARS